MWPEPEAGAVFDVERFQPLQDRLLVRPDKPQELTHGGIIIPAAFRPASGFGTVLAMGQGLRQLDGSRRPMPDIRLGSRIVFDARHPFLRTQLNGEELIIVRDDMVLGELVEEAHNGG